MAYEEWLDILETQGVKAKRVAKTDLVNGRGWVSTVWLGLNHQYGNGAPLIFETMVFPVDSMIEKDCQRYSTEEEAIKGHQQMVEKWSASEVPE